MKDIAYTTLDNTTGRLNASEIEALVAGIRGEVLTPRDGAYDAARKIWNGMVDRRPAVIVRCSNAQDVRHAVNFAREHRMLVSVRGGGHHIAGNSVADGSLVIDQSGLRTVRVDPERRTARVAPGALLGDFDREAQAFGLATPLGINSTTGVAGLTLGGGFGWLSRKHGMTIDNLIAADIVTADGRQRVVSATQEPDLFWAIRGGGGNFGVVTSFEFKLHPVGPEVYSGLVVYPFDQAQQVLRAWRDFTIDAPTDLSVWAVLRKAPPLPFLPESIHGKDVVVFAVVYAGDLAAGERAAAPVLGFGTPVGSALGPTPYAGFQAAFDPLLQPGARNYWKSHNLDRLDDGLLDRRDRRRRSVAGARVRGVHRPARRRHGASRARGYGLRRARRELRHERPRPLAERGRRRSGPRVGAPPVPERRALQHRRRVRELLYRGRG